MKAMKANELIIGNIVTVDNPQFHPNLKDVPMVIKGIHTTERGYAVKLEHLIPSDDIFTEYSQLIQFIIPIPLTEEILLKAGFEKHRKGYSLNVGGESFDYYIKDKFVIWDHKHRGYSLESIRSQGFIFYKYLHQLQNLFFALTGEEIKIELE